MSSTTFHETCLSSCDRCFWYYDAARSWYSTTMIPPSPWYDDSPYLPSFEAVHMPITLWSAVQAMRPAIACLSVCRSSCSHPTPNPTCSRNIKTQEYSHSTSMCFVISFSRAIAAVVETNSMLSYRKMWLHVSGISRTTCFSPLWKDVCSIEMKSLPGLSPLQNVSSDTIVVLKEVLTLAGSVCGALA